MKRLLAAALAAVMLFSGCNEAAEMEEIPPEQDNVVETLPVIQEEVEVKPLILACGRNFAENHPAHWSGADEDLLPLLYDSLVELDDQYQPAGGLAQEIQQDGLSYTITIKEAVFSDGSDVRAADVANSLAAAMEEGSPWAKRLSIVSDCSVLLADMIRITLTEPRQDFVNLLTFPVTKALNNGTYLGSGQYMLSEEQDFLLVKNPNYSGNYIGPDSIALRELPNSETLRDSLRIGIISCLFDDLSDGEAMNLSERTDSVEIGNLVFLGVNNQEGLCAAPEVRRAIYGTIDRQLLADRVYASKAQPAELPFHPAYYRIQDYETKQLSLDEARALLESAGLVKNSYGYYGNEEQAVLKLIYHSENVYRAQTAEMLKQQMDNLGLSVELQGLPYEEYMAALDSGEFDLYLGELAIDDSMDIRRLIQRGESYGFGCETESSLLGVYRSYQQGTASIELFLSVYQQNMPAIPLLYRQGIIVYDERVVETFSSQSDRAFAAVSVP